MVRFSERLVNSAKRVVRRVNPLRPRPAFGSHAAFSDPPPKALGNDLLGRMREIISDPLNLLIDRHALAGLVDEAGRVRLHNGIVVPISGEFAYYEDFSAILVLNRGVHEPLEEFVFQEVLKTLGPQPSMLELGAYWSHYSMWLKSARPVASVTMVEPDAHNIEVGKRNFEANGLRGAFIRAEVSDQGFTVDDFLDRGDGHLTILHSDIQGFEGQMLKGARRALHRKAIERLFVSTHSEELHAACLGEISAAGYVIEIESAPDAHSTSYDGFIFASSPTTAPIFSEFKPLGRVELAGKGVGALVTYLHAAQSGKQTA